MVTKTWEITAVHFKILSLEEVTKKITNDCISFSKPMASQVCGITSALLWQEKKIKIRVPK